MGLGRKKAGDASAYVIAMNTRSVSDSRITIWGYDDVDVEMERTELMLL